jgi:Tfp pilus assembly protein PilF
MLSLIGRLIDCFCASLPILNNIGWTHHEAGRYEQALAMFQKALHERKAASHAEQIRIARWCVAHAQRSLGQFEVALATQRELLAELEQAGEKDGYACGVKSSKLRVKSCHTINS